MFTCKAIICFVLLLGTLEAVSQPKPKNTAAPQKDYTEIKDTVYEKTWTKVSSNGDNEYFYAGSGADPEIKTDFKGNMYSIQNNYRRINHVFKFDGNIWVDIHPPGLESAYAIWTTEKDELVAKKFDPPYYVYNGNTWRIVKDTQEIRLLDMQKNHSAYQRYLSRLSMQNLPSLPSSYTKSLWVSHCAPSIRVIAENQEEPGKIEILELNNNSWKTIAKYNTKLFYLFPTYLATPAEILYGEPHKRGNFLLLNNDIYYEHLKDIYRFNPNATSFTVSVKRIYTNEKIPTVGYFSKDDTEVLDYAGIYKVNGKMGIRSRGGYTIVHPVFESIVFTNSNSVSKKDEETAHAFHLKGNGMDIYVPALSSIGPDTIQGFITTKKTCAVCNGKGRANDKTIQKEVTEKEWVPESSTVTSTSTISERVWDASCKCYKTVSRPVSNVRTTPGYYKTKTTYRSETIPGAACKACESGEKAITVTRQVFYFDKASQKYIAKDIVSYQKVK